ncbi:MAG: HupE/UreJ family protein [Deltaproteobacteria bacterium]|nr:HupE/UreJ family protein [Nannocystaceae bacterium]
MRPVQAHEMRPAYVQILEGADGTFLVRQRVHLPKPSLAPPTIVWPADCETVGTPVRTRGDRDLDDAGSEARSGSSDSEQVADEYRMRCASSAFGRSLEVVGLRVEFSEMVAQVIPYASDPTTVIVRRSDPQFTLGTPQRVDTSFLQLGVAHIAYGADHLLFVVCLVLSVLGPPRPRRVAGLRLRTLLLTITSFTFAHSLTLGLSTLGAVTLPPRGVETVIALSILVLARELALGGSSRASERPWLLAFAFGLLHGFGFAGALREVGLPEQAQFAALLAFNVGVELGQLVFVSGCLLVIALVDRALRTRPILFDRACIHAIGAVSAYWFADRAFLIVCA